MIMKTGGPTRLGSEKTNKLAGDNVPKWMVGNGWGRMGRRQKVNWIFASECEFD